MPLIVFCPFTREPVLCQSTRKHHGIVVIPWQILATTEANLSGWLVTAAWDCEHSQKDNFKTHHCFVLSFYSLCLAGVCLCLLPLPWPICGFCSTQMGSSKNLLSNLIFSKHMYTESFWGRITRPNVGAFSQEWQITYLITRQFSLPNCKSLWNKRFIRVYELFSKILSLKKQKTIISLQLLRITSSCLCFVLQTAVLMSFWWHVFTLVKATPAG